MIRPARPGLSVEEVRKEREALEWAAAAPWSALALGGRAGWVWAAAFAGAALLLAPRGVPGRWLGLVLLAPLVLQRPPGPAPGSLAVTVLDVGQGLAVLMRTANHALIYDTGPAFPSGFNTGGAVVAPALRDFDLARLDLLMLSHADLDHAGGHAGLLAALPVERILSGEPSALGGAHLGQPPADAPTPEPCRAGQGWTWDGVRFEILHPTDGQERGNNSSCVLRVDAGGASLLLPGDIKARVERGLVAGGVDRLQAEVLIAAHHGSETSTTAEFLDAVDPAWVLFTSGYANRYGFPARAVRERVAALGIATLDTATSGAIGLVLDPVHGLRGPWAERAQQARLWRHRPPP